MSNKSLSAPQKRAIQIGQAANQAAASRIFADYVSRKSDNTLRTQRHGLAAFADFLAEVGIGEISAEILQSTPSAWLGITWGLVEAFAKWQLNIGYAVATVNNRLSAVKAYAKLASKAGVIPPEDNLLIQSVTGYGHKEGLRIDQRRDVTRLGSKKAEHVKITLEQARVFKQPSDETPQAKRDAFLMCLLLDHGLRCGEVAGLKVAAIELEMGVLRFFRPKVSLTQTHYLTSSTLTAYKAYLPFLINRSRTQPLLRGSRKGGKLTDAQMSVRAITKRVQVLGQQQGISGLSAHDCRHYWATNAAHSGTDPFVLQEAGGWSSLTMPRRYVASAEIANKGVRLEE
ncbi:MAG: tyrosine-type recombinase/integrase [Candidatus Promineifilaceae bacterium]